MIRSIIILLSGSIFAQIISLISSPVITRIFDPEDFGLFSTFNAYVAFILPIVSLSLPMALVLPKNKTDAYEIIKASIFVSIAMIMMYSIFVLIISYQLLENQSYVIAILSIPTIFLSVLVEALTYWAVRLENYKTQSIAILSNSLCVNCFKISIGYFYPTTEVLVLSLLFGAVIQLLILKRSISLNEVFRNSPKHLGLVVNKTLVKYKEIIIFRTLQNVLTAANSMLPLILMTNFYGSVYTGYYALTRTVMYLPLNLLGRAINNVFYPAINKRYNRNEPILKNITIATVMLATVGLLPFSIIYFYGEDIFGLIFGSKWSHSGVFASYLCPWLYMNLINRCCIASVSVLKMERYLFANSLFNTLIIILVFYTSITLGFECDELVKYFGYSSMFPQMMITIMVFFKAYSHDNKLRIIS